MCPTLHAISIYFRGGILSQFLIKTDGFEPVYLPIKMEFFVVRFR